MRYRLKRDFQDIGPLNGIERQGWPRIIPAQMRYLVVSPIEYESGLIGFSEFARFSAGRDACLFVSRMCMRMIVVDTINGQVLNSDIMSQTAIDKFLETMP